MSYYVYDTWGTRSKAIIHRGKCHYCKQGQGLNHKDKRASSQWHGPFETLQQAEEKAYAVGRKAVRKCTICLPA